jgi:hypothetical protein
MNKPLTKRRFIIGFAAVTLVLALVRLLFPQVAEARDERVSSKEKIQTMGSGKQSVDHQELVKAETVGNTAAAGLPAKKHPIRSVPSYRDCFPDTNAVQLAAARKWGVSPVKNRADAEARMRELVFVGASPYYHVDPLRQSIPYLVPRAAVLLGDIGKAFFDSLYVKGVPLHRFIVTSVLRTEDDVARLRHFNGNATENSCHLYATTFDICYNRYQTVEPPDGEGRRAVRNDTLKYVLSEVLNDMRQQGRCYIKYEVKQGCFHLTVR